MPKSLHIKSERPSLGLSIDKKQKKSKSTSTVIPDR